jgi:Ser/Thr protein kinase RdoA (MazF antagonist)
MAAVDTGWYAGMMHMDDAGQLAAWPGLGDFDELRGGHRVTTAQAVYNDLLVVVRRSDRDAASLDWELDLLAHLHSYGIAVPRLIPALDGRRHVNGWHVYQYVEGNTATNEDEEAVHEAARHVHAATAGWPQRPGFRSSFDLLHQMRGGDVYLDAMPGSLVAEIRAAWRAVTPIATAVIHGDLGAGNAIIGPGGHVTLIDWDESRVDDTGFDIGDSPAWRRAQLAWEVATCWVKEPEYAQDLAVDLTRSR